MFAFLTLEVKYIVFIELLSGSLPTPQFITPLGLKYAKIFGYVRYTYKWAWVWYKILKHSPYHAAGSTNCWVNNKCCCYCFHTFFFFWELRIWSTFWPIPNALVYCKTYPFDSFHPSPHICFYSFTHSCLHPTKFTITNKMKMWGNI